MASASEVWLAEPESFAISILFATKLIHHWNKRIVNCEQKREKIFLHCFAQDLPMFWPGFAWPIIIAHCPGSRNITNCLFIICKFNNYKFSCWPFVLAAQFQHGFIPVRFQCWTDFVLTHSFIYINEHCIRATKIFPFCLSVSFWNLNLNFKQIPCNGIKSIKDWIFNAFSLLYFAILVPKIQTNFNFLNSQKFLGINFQKKFTNKTEENICQWKIIQKKR